MRFTFTGMADQGGIDVVKISEEIRDASMRLPRLSLSRIYYYILYWCDLVRLLNTETP